MAGLRLKEGVLSPIERTGGHTSVSFGGPVMGSYGNVQPQQCSGVLIKLLKVPSDRQTDERPSISFEEGMEEKSLRKPSTCWICRRLLACISKILGGRNSSFILGSSTSNCALNHELLIIIRLFLKKISVSPDTITLESESLGPLRLALASKRSNTAATITAHSDQFGIQSSALTARKIRSADHSQDMYTAQCYDVYQEPQAMNSGVPDMWIPRATRIPKNSGSNECLNCAKAWLDHCLREHPQCRIRTVPLLPRRVIDVKEDGLRLFVPKYGTRGHWTALSHCWGKVNTFKTTVNTVQSHERGIEWDELPKTFKDAVLVTRALGVQYLWIDSLCIIQDDGGADFHTEAAKMCDIYRDSILTIAASCSVSDCAGFLRDRIIYDPIKLHSPQRLQSVRLRPTIDHSRMLRDDPIHSRAWTFQETILPHRLLSFGSREASWDCETVRQCECGQIEYRQEARIISNELGRAAYRRYTKAVVEGTFHVGKQYDIRRIDDSLPPYEYFGSLMLRSNRTPMIAVYAKKLLAEAPAIENQVAYREYIEKVRRRTMRDVITTAGYPSTDSEGFIPFEIPHNPSWAFRPEDVPACAEWLENNYNNKLAVNTFYWYWRRVLVPEYTRRALSNDGDRLIALQAMATDICSGIHDRYLAGLWEGDLINQLCWKSTGDQNLPADNQSPSWSWSSIRGPIVPCLGEKCESVFELADEFEDMFDLTGGNLPDSSLSDKSSDVQLTGEAKADRFEHKQLARKRMTISSAACSLGSRNPCGRILNGSIMVYTLAMKVQYVMKKETGLLEFHASASGADHPEPRVSEPLKLEFIPDTPLGCQSDGSLSRSAERDSLNRNHRDQAMTAIILFVKGTLDGDFCVLVCGLVPAAAKPNTYRRLGIGTIKSRNHDSFVAYASMERLVLI